MRIQTISLFFIIIFNSAKCDDDCPNKDKSELAPIRLKKDLLCNYEKTVRPVVNHQNATKVAIQMLVKYFTYEMHSRTFSIDSWMTIFWKDEHLKWDPDKYDSLKMIHLSTDEIWQPDLSLYNGIGEPGSPAAFGETTCIVHNTGQVVCVPPARQSSLCVPDLAKYPFDTQNCTVRLGSWVHTGEEIDFRLSSPAIGLDDLLPNGEWQLVRTAAFRHRGDYKCCPNNTYPSLNFSFVIRRLGAGHMASVILPMVALVLLTLTALWVPPRRPERLTLCGVNVVCTFIFNENIAWMVPTNGDVVPNIVRFTRDSLLLASLSTVLAVLLKNVVEGAAEAPAWVRSINGFVSGCRPGQLILLSDYSVKGVAAMRGDEDGTGIIGNSENPNRNEGWPLFARIVDRLCFILYLIIYFVMFVCFIP